MIDWKASCKEESFVINFSHKIKSWRVQLEEIINQMICKIKQIASTYDKLITERLHLYMLSIIKKIIRNKINVIRF